ncbi:MAG: hypothetical protein H0W85_06735, partial [Methylotenera sp.]|nr:hypothetical protein [Methylotenera sp.]
LGTSNISACLSIPLNFEGRIPANPIPDWNSTSILRSISSGNWFQQNGWREHMYYAISLACSILTPNCSGVGYLTLNGAVNANVNKNMITIADGLPLTGQMRATAADKLTLTNYFEQGNATTLDNAYNRVFPLTNSFNDLTASIP